ncbi:hypothetical protein D3C78_1611620 [compost metagenome]
MPTFSRRLPLAKPGVPASTRNRLVPLAPAFGSVLATTITRSARKPLVMKVLEPLMTYSSPSSTAVVFTPCRSEPAPGSVMAMALTISPDTSFGRYLCFSISLP